MQGDERVRDAVGGEDVRGGAHLRRLWHEEHEGHSHERAALHAGGGLAREGGQADVNLLLHEPRFDLVRATGLDGEMKSRHAFAHARQEGG